MPPPLGSKDAVVINEGDREAAKSNSRWESLRTFHRAPCLAPSVGIGAAGGLGIGGLRYISGSGGRSAFTWGSVVAGLLAGTSWFTWAQRAETVFVTIDAVDSTDSNVTFSEGLLSVELKTKAKEFKVENMPLMKEIEPNESKWFRNDR